MVGQITLTALEKDALREVGNIGTGNATTALSTLLNTHIEIIIPNIDFIPINRFANELGGAEKLVVASYLALTGDVKGESLFICPVKSAEKIADLMLNQEIGKSKIEDEMVQSVFKEISNIFTGAYLNSIADFLEMRILPSVPDLATDMLQAIMDEILSKVANHSDEILCIKTEIQIKNFYNERYFI